MSASDSGSGLLISAYTGLAEKLENARKNKKNGEKELECVFEYTRNERFWYQP
jgi:hypothetical protein